MSRFYEIFSKVYKTEDTEQPFVKPKIIVDYREKNSLIASELVHLGCEIQFSNLEIGDYIIKNTIIERKTISDFLSSMMNKRLSRQLDNLQQVESKLLIIEGIDEHNIYSRSNINESAVRGFMLSILLNYKVPIIFTKDYEDSAKFIYVLAKKPSKSAENGLNAKRKSFDSGEQMQFIIEGFPGIGPKTAKKLLAEFKTIKNIINASEEDLKKLIGKKSEIFRLSSKAFQ